MYSLTEVKLPSKRFRQYQALTPSLYRAARRVAADLKGLTVFHINSTQLGGGVAELLMGQVPLERSLKLNSRWFVLDAKEDFFEVTKKIHNMLQGDKSASLSKEEQNLYFNTIRSFAPRLERIIAEGQPDIVVFHDPQPLPLVQYLPRSIIPMLRLHIDLSSPNTKAVRLLQPLIEKYQCVIYSSPAYRLRRIPHLKTKIIMPAIDPFAAKNRPLKDARKILASHGISTTRPIASQVSRFDKWKDPLGVLRAYGIAKKRIPGLQLILAGSLALDDPEGKVILQSIRKRASQDPDSFIFTKHDNVLVNAIQSASDVIFQKSLREGFGLTVTEAMWKEKAVIGGRTAGIKLQIQNGKNGFLVSSPNEAARQLVRLIRDPGLRKRIGKAARKTVRDKFLLSRLILDHLRAYTTVYKMRKKT